MLIYYQFYYINSMIKETHPLLLKASLEFSNL